VVAALDDCARGLAASWGLDVARLDDMTSGPRLLNGAAVRRGIGNSFAEHWRWYSHTDGIAHVRVIVNEAGQPEDCTVIYGTTGAAPNDRACRIMRKARFAPALDDEGKPVRAAFSASFKDRRRNASSFGIAGD
jgi:TonB family protein